MPLRTRCVAIVTLLVSLLDTQLLAAQNRPAGTLTVFAAASMRNALDEIGAAFTAATGVTITASYAASSALARQIEQGAPADIYISANIKWMDFLDGKKLVQAGSRINLLGNRLVLIAPKDSRLDNITIENGFDLVTLAGNGRIAVADTRAVPAGLYAKAALTALGAWTTAEPRLAQSENVRATLAYVARGEAPVGIVYATDARAEPKVKIIGTFPAGSHPPITYPASAIAGGKSPNAGRYLDFLQTRAAKDVFERHGFNVLVPSKAS